MYMRTTKKGQFWLYTGSMRVSPEPLYQWCSQDSDQQDQDSEFQDQEQDQDSMFQDQDFVAQDQDSGSRLKLNDKDVLIKQACAAEMAVRYADLRACHCNSLGGATWRSVMIITGRTDRQTDRQSATQYAAPS